MLEFFDDRLDILNPLYQVFSHYPRLIPKQVMLRLTAYNGRIGPGEHYIQGTGEVDFTFRENIKLMLLLCGFEGEYYGYIDVVSTLNIEDFLALRQLQTQTNVITLTGTSANFFQTPRNAGEVIENQQCLQVTISQPEV